MVRFHPQWLRARELVRAGQDRRAEGRAGVLLPTTTATRRTSATSPETGGGAHLRHRLLRHRLRPLHLRGGADARRLADRPRSGFGTDRLTSVIADFGGGRQLNFIVVTQIGAHQRVTLGGTKGRIEILIPFNAPQMEATRILVDDGSKLGGASSVEEVFPPVDQYAEEADAFARAVLGETRASLRRRRRGQQHADHRRHLPLRRDGQMGIDRALMRARPDRAAALLRTVPKHNC